MGGVDILQDIVDAAKSKGGGLRTALGLSKNPSAVNMEEVKQAPDDDGDLNNLCEKVRGPYLRFVF